MILFRGQPDVLGRVGLFSGGIGAVAKDVPGDEARLGVSLGTEQFSL